MAKVGRKPKPKVQRAEKPVAKCDSLETERRVRIVLDWILSDQMVCDILATSAQKWGVSERQTHRYIEQARALINSVNSDKIQQHINYQIERSKRALRQLDEKHKTTPAGVFAIKAMLEHMAKIQGIYINKVDHTTKGKEIKPVDPVRFVTYSESLKEKDENG